MSNNLMRAHSYQAGLPEYYIGYYTGYEGYVNNKPRFAMMINYAVPHTYLISSSYWGITYSKPYTGPMPQEVIDKEVSDIENNKFSFKDHVELDSLNKTDMTWQG